eukprot:5220937-Amphidinium_carterae.2
MVAIRGRHHNVLKDRCEGSNEQGTLTVVEQTFLPGDRQEKFVRGTTSISGCYKMGNHTTAYQQWYKGHQVPILWQRPNICSYTFINGNAANATSTYKRHHQAIHSLHNRRGQCIPQYTNRRVSHCATSKGVLPQSTQYIVEDDKNTLRSTRITHTMASTEYNPTKKLTSTRLKRDACVFANKQSSIYPMANVDDLLVVGDNMATQQFLQQFQQHLELKHTTQLTMYIYIYMT